MAFPISGMEAAMDLCLLMTAQLCISSLNIRRLALAWMLFLVCTLAFHGSETIWILHVPVLLLGAAIATGERRPQRIWEAALCMLCASAAAAGFCIAGQAALPSAAGGCMLTLLLLRKRRHQNHCWNIEVRVCIADMEYSFPALIDTGNRLREHRSGSPVLIVEEAAAPGLSAVMDRLDETRKRALPYGVLGSRGELKCFHPDHIEIVLPGSGRTKAPDCWVAVFPGRIPGNTRALAPPEFAEASQGRGFIRREFQERVRRFNDYGVFKREAIHLRARGANSQGLGLLHRRK